VSDRARVSENAVVSVNAFVTGDASVSGNAVVKGKARVGGKALISGEAKITGGFWDGSEGPVERGEWRSQHEFLAWWKYGKVHLNEEEAMNLREDFLAWKKRQRNG